jgi:hypothetical protein
MPPPRPNASRPTPVRVERIATTPMSRPLRDQAVTALALLITAWQHRTATETGEDPASPVPLPAEASDTDHAPPRAPITARTGKGSHDTGPRPATGDGRRLR